MLFSIIGTGNMAWFMAKRLSSAGHTCLAVYGRNQLAVTELAHEVNATPVYKLEDIKDNADACIIAISDHEIEHIASLISLPHTVLVHTAGAIDSNLLAKAGPNYGVLWPAYSLLKSDLPTHRNIPCIWEASNARAKEVISVLASSLSDTVYEAGSQQRKWLHLCAVLGNNFTNHLMAVCERICEEQQLPFALLQPILRQTFDKVQTHHPYDVQTGPAKRNDNLTLKAHIALLQQHPEWQELYEAISHSITEMYNRS